MFPKPVYSTIFWEKMPGKFGEKFGKNVIIFDIYNLNIAGFGDKKNPSKREGSWFSKATFRKRKIAKTKKHWRLAD